VRSIPEWRRKYFHLALRRGRKIAKVAMARRLAIGLYWMWRNGWDYEQVKKFGSQGRKFFSHVKEHWFDSVPEAAEFPDHPARDSPKIAMV